jgi:hypothetical protein
MIKIMADNHSTPPIEPASTTGITTPGAIVSIRIPSKGFFAGLGCDGSLLLLRRLRGLLLRRMAVRWL